MFLDMMTRGKLRRVFPSLKTVSRRLCHSLLPPHSIFGSARVEVDPVGPFLTLAAMWSLLELGRQGGEAIPPLVAMVGFLVPVACVTYALLRAGQSCLSWWQVGGLLGYAQVGHLLTLLSGLLFRTRESHWTFLLSLTVFGGLSAIRLVLVFAFRTRKPACILLAGCMSCVPHLLFILFTYFSYIPPLKR